MVQQSALETACLLVDLAFPVHQIYEPSLDHWAHESSYLLAVLVVPQVLHVERDPVLLADHPVPEKGYQLANLQVGRPVHLLSYPVHQPLLLQGLQSVL